MSSDQITGQDLPQGVGLTSLIMAQARTAESARPDRLFDDPFATAFVAEAGLAFPAASGQIANLLRLRGPYVALRTRFFDDYLQEAAGAGCRQIVLLAAGLDARAFRLPWPEGTALYELDLPEVLAFKERALARWGARPACLRFPVPVDLADDWPAALVQAGFTAGEPAAWLAEGLLMYLAEEQRDLLLDRIGNLSAPGSRLAFDQRGGRQDGGREVKSESDEQAAALGVRIPGAQLDPSIADIAGWLERHGWRPRVYDAGEGYAFYGRRAPALQPGEAIQGWLATARRA